MTNPAAHNWRDIGPTDASVYHAEFNRLDSPLVPHAIAMHEAAGEDSALALAHMFMENKYSTTGHIIMPDHNNPMALRPGPGISVKHGNITAPDGSQFLTFTTPADCVREWQRRINDPAYKADEYPGGAYTSTTTLNEYLSRYAPAGDVHPVTGKDNADINYLGTVTTMLQRFAAAEAPVVTPAPEAPMATHRYILSAGHRNTDGGGAWRGPESAWTYPICKKLKAAIERRGGQAWIISEEDGDSDPSFTHGRGLQATARLCVDLANAVGGVDAYLSMHYEGATHRIQGVFGIYPDATGLSPSSSVDVAANNPLDIQMIKNITKEVGKTGMPVRSGGLMSERSTYVGSQGYRLGEMYGTIGFRDRTARAILEAGQAEHPEDYARMWDPEWQDDYVEAIVDGLELTFGAFPQGKPEPKPEAPKEQYAAAKPIPELSDDRPFLVTDGGSTLVRADLIVKATKNTPRLMYADKNSAKIGPDIGVGQEFAVDYVVLNPDGSRYWYTPWGTRVAYEDTEIVRADAA